MSQQQQQYIYDAPDRQKTVLMFGLLYLFGSALYWSSRSADDSLSSLFYVKKPIKKFFIPTLTNVLTWLFDVCGIERPDAFELFVELKADILTYNIIGGVFIVAMMVLSHKDEASPFDGLMSVVKSYNILVTGVFRLTLLFLFYELIRRTGHFLYISHHHHQENQESSVS